MKQFMKLLSSLKVGDRICGWVHACAECGAWFIGRKDAKYCSGACRLKAHRERS